MKVGRLKIPLLLILPAVAAMPLMLSAQAKRGVPDAVTRLVTVSSQPGAVVWIDGVRYGKTGQDGRLEIKTVAAGAHTLRVRSDGFAEKSQPLTAFQNGDIQIALVKTADEAELSFQEAERQSTLDRDKAVAAYRKAIKARPNYPDAYIGLARVLSEAGDTDEAMKAVVGAKRLRPGFAEASAVEGRIYKDNGEEDRAIAAFKRAITEGKAFQPEAYTGLGLLYKERAEGFGGSGDFAQEDANYNEAAKNLKVAVKQLSGAPDTVIIYQLLGLIYERQKRLADAIALYEEFLRLFPDSPEATSVRSFIVQLKKAN